MLNVIKAGNTTLHVDSIDNTADNSLSGGRAGQYISVWSGEGL